MVVYILLMVECVFVFCTTFALVIKTNSIMKEIKIVEKGENFTTVNVGKLNEIKEYELAMGNFSINLDIWISVLCASRPRCSTKPIIKAML